MLFFLILKMSMGLSCESHNEASPPLKRGINSSVYELVEGAKSSIWVSAYSLTDRRVIELLNKKATVGVEVQIMTELSVNGVDSLVKHVRLKGEKRLQRMVIVDDSYVWMSALNGVGESFTNTKNSGICYYSPSFAAIIKKS